jgi:hypothetical protein
VNRKWARTLFVAALGLYLLWFSALVVMAVVSGERPISASTAHPASAPLDVDRTKD